MEFVIAAYTDTGIQKTVNQDSLCLRRAAIPAGGELMLAVVCDGMGGLEKGELASAECVRAFGNWFDQNLGQLPALCRGNFEEVRRQWEELFRSIHSRLLRYAVDNHVQLGTTAAVFLACEGRYLVANLGDSRVYARRDTLEQLTQDHSLVAREIALGRITEEEARHHPQRNILLQCLGSGESISPSYYEGRLQSDCLYFLCTDGYVHELSRAELSERLTPLYLSTRESMTEVLTSLAEDCKGRGETDNLTAVLIKTAETALNRPRGLRLLFGRRKDTPEGAAVLVETAQLIHTTESIQ